MANRQLLCNALLVGRNDDEPDSDVMPCGLQCVRVSGLGHLDRLRLARSTFGSKQR